MSFLFYFIWDFFFLYNFIDILILLSDIFGILYLRKSGKCFIELSLFFFFQRYFEEICYCQNCSDKSFQIVVICLDDNLKY